MNIDSILLSDHARVDAGGKLTVVGAFNRITGPGPVWRLPYMAISMVIHGHADEAGTEHEIEIELKHESGDVLTEEPMKLSFKFQDRESLHPGIPARHVATHTILVPTFDRPGAYAFNVYIDGTYHASTSLYIRKTDGG